MNGVDVDVVDVDVDVVGVGNRFGQYRDCIPLHCLGVVRPQANGAPSGCRFAFCLCVVIYAYLVPFLL